MTFMERFKRGQAGYTLMEVLIVATIIAIITTVGTVSYLEAKRRAKEMYAAQRLAQLAVFERMYFRDFASYGDYEDLRTEGYIDEQYLYKDDEPTHYHRPVYIQDYKLTFNIDEAGGGFEIIAEPVLGQHWLWYPRWTALGGIPYLRAVTVNQDGVVRWLDSNRPVM